MGGFNGGNLIWKMKTKYNCPGILFSLLELVNSNYSCGYSTIWGIIKYQSSNTLKEKLYHNR